MTPTPAFGTLVLPPAENRPPEPLELPWLESSLSWLTALTLACFALELFARSAIP